MFKKTKSRCLKKCVVFGKEVRSRFVSRFQVFLKKNFVKKLCKKRKSWPRKSFSGPTLSFFNSLFLREKGNKLKQFLF
jgi:hypothetical protein